MFEGCNLLSVEGPFLSNLFQTFSCNWTTLCVCFMLNLCCPSEYLLRWVLSKAGWSLVNRLGPFLKLSKTLLTYTYSQCIGVLYKEKKLHCGISVTGWNWFRGKLWDWFYTGIKMPNVFVFHWVPYINLSSNILWKGINPTILSSSGIISMTCTTN